MRACTRPQMDVCASQFRAVLRGSYRRRATSGGRTIEVIGASCELDMRAELRNGTSAEAASVTSLNDSSSSIGPGDASPAASTLAPTERGCSRCTAVCESPISMARLHVENGAVNGSAARTANTNAHPRRHRATLRVSDFRDRPRLRVDGKSDTMLCRVYKRYATRTGAGTCGISAVRRRRQRRDPTSVWCISACPTISSQMA